MAAPRIMRIIARMNTGGPAVEISGLMRHLNSDAFEQRLLTGWCSSHEEDYLTVQAPDVAVTRIPGLGRAVKPADDLAAFRALVSQMREFQPDIIHTHTAKAGVLGRMASGFMQKRPIRVHTYHGHILSGYFSRTKVRAIIQAEKLMARRSDALITVGRQVRDELLSVGIGSMDKYSVIPPGLEKMTYPSRNFARSSLGLDPDAPVICVVGRLTQIKRPDRIVDIARILKNQYFGMTILVAGEGELREYLMQKISTEDLPITMLGWRDDVETVFAASDVALLTSDNEGTPISLIQAALAGIPSVATDVGAVGEVVLDRETGLLTPPNSNALANSISALLDNPEQRISLGEAARARAADLYTIERFTEAHADLYNSLLSSRSRKIR